VGADELLQLDRTTRSSIQSQPEKDVPVAEALVVTTPVATTPVATTPVVTTPATATRKSSSSLKVIQAKRLEVQVVITKLPGFDRS
jgi:hypothetical protein